MKINIFTILSAFVAVLSLVSCSEDLDYKKACAEKDWLKAYEIVDKLQKKEAKVTEISVEQGWSFEPLHYVVTQEALFVLDEYGDNGLVRIIGIAKEHDARNQSYYVCIG